MEIGLKIKRDTGYIVRIKCYAIALFNTNHGDGQCIVSRPCPMDTRKNPEALWALGFECLRTCVIRRYAIPG